MLMLIFDVNACRLATHSQTFSILVGFVNEGKSSEAEFARFKLRRCRTVKATKT